MGVAGLGLAAVAGFGLPVNKLFASSDTTAEIFTGNADGVAING